MRIIDKELTIQFTNKDMERLDFILQEAQKSTNLCDYDKEFLFELRKIIDYNMGYSK